MGTSHRSVELKSPFLGGFLSPYGSNQFGPWIFSHSLITPHYKQLLDSDFVAPLIQYPIYYPTLPKISPFYFPQPKTPRNIQANSILLNLPKTPTPKPPPSRCPQCIYNPTYQLSSLIPPTPPYVELYVLFYRLKDQCFPAYLLPKPALPNS